MMSVTPTGHHRIVFDAPTNNTDCSSNLSHITKPENWSGSEPTTSPLKVTRKKENSRRTFPSSTSESMETSEDSATVGGDDASTIPSGPKSPRRCDDEEQGRPATEQTMTYEQPSSPCSSRSLNNVNKKDDDNRKDDLTQLLSRNFVDAVVPRGHDDDDDDNDGLIAEESIELIESSRVIDISGGSAGSGVDPIVRAVKCQINVRKNGEMEVIVPGDEEMSRKLQELLRLRLRQMLPQPIPTTATIEPPTPSSIPPTCPPLKLANLSTIAELETLEGQLKDPAMLKRMKENIKRIGGKTGPDTMRRNLKNLMTDSLANEFRWAGREGKKNFKDLTLATILMDSIRESHSTATVLHLENAIKSWLKQAPHRLHNSSKP